MGDDYLSFYQVSYLSLHLTDEVIVGMYYRFSVFGHSEQVIHRYIEISDEFHNRYYLITEFFTKVTQIILKNTYFCSILSGCSRCRADGNLYCFSDYSGIWDTAFFFVILSMRYAGTLTIS